MHSDGTPKAYRPIARATLIVTPAKAGVQKAALDSRFRGNDDSRFRSVFSGCCGFLVTLICLSRVAVAQESPSDWIKRILDPATIKVVPFENSEMNRKITIDTIRTDDPRKRIAVYMAPLDQLKAASSHFAKTL